jgi:hypothetical protein
MSPQSAQGFVSKLAELFDEEEFTRSASEILYGMFEKYSEDVATAAVTRLAEESSQLDRGRLRTLLQEEHGRRVYRASQTGEWRSTKEAEAEAIDRAFKQLPKPRLQELISDIRKTEPNILALLKSDPLETDVGRSLVYTELKKRRAI